MRQAALIQVQAEVVAGRGQQICESLMQVKDEGGRDKSAERNGWITPFKPPQRIAANKQTRGHVACGDAALAPGEREVTAQLAKRTFGGQWN